jgi:hypothetical protein
MTPVASPARLQGILWERFSGQGMGLGNEINLVRRSESSFADLGRSVRANRRSCLVQCAVVRWDQGRLIAVGCYTR